jgi:predicted nucleic acid-binding protein
LRFVDTNVFIYVFIKSPKKDYEIARRILQRIENGEEAATSIAVIYEAVDWLEYNNREIEVGSFLTAINSYLSLSKLSIEWDKFLSALKEKYDRQIDFVDTLNLRVMREIGVTEIYSNDKDFDRINGIKRIWE